MGLSRVENVTTSQLIREARKKEKLRQEDIANKLGVSRQMFSQWEIGARSPKVERFIDIMDVMGYDVFITIEKKGVIL